jgi:hypothetical protein
MSEIQERRSAFVVIESREPTYPDYVWVWHGENKEPSGVFGSGLKLEKTFQEYDKTYVWVYRVI